MLLLGSLEHAPQENFNLIRLNLEAENFEAVKLMVDG